MAWSQFAVDDVSTRSPAVLRRNVRDETSAIQTIKTIELPRLLVLHSWHTSELGVTLRSVPLSVFPPFTVPLDLVVPVAGPTHRFYAILAPRYVLFLLTGHLKQSISSAA